MHGYVVHGVAQFQTLGSKHRNAIPRNILAAPSERFAFGYHIRFHIPCRPFYLVFSYHCSSDTSCGDICAYISWLLCGDYIAESAETSVLWALCYHLNFDLLWHIWLVCGSFLSRQVIWVMKFISITTTIMPNKSMQRTPLGWPICIGLSCMVSLSSRR